MLTILHFDSLRQTPTNVIKKFFEQNPSEYRLVDAYDQSYPELKEIINTSDKVLICGSKSGQKFFKELFSRRKVSDANLRQWWSDLYGKPFYYTPDPNQMSTDVDAFMTFVTDLDFALKTPATRMVLPTPPQYNIINNQSMLERMIADIASINPNYVVVDIETTELSYLKGRLRCIGIASTPNRLYIVPDVALKSASFVNTLRDFLQNPKYNFVGHNANQFDRVWLRYLRLADVDFKFDSMLGDYCLDERQGIHALDDISARRYYVQTWKEVLADWVRQRIKERDAALKQLDKGMEDYENIKRLIVNSFGVLDEDNPYCCVPDELLWKYCALDLHFQYKITEETNNELRAEGRLEEVHDNLLIPAAYHIGITQETGALIDREYLENLNKHNEKQIEVKTKELAELAGEEINPKSPKQIHDYLYLKLGLPKPKGEKTSDSASDEESLKTLNHPVANKILEVRRYKSINDNYVKKILDYSQYDGRLHGNYKLHGTQTGRLSCSDPPLQTMPSVDREWYCEDFNIRNAFIAKPGFTLIEGDYSQLELRIMAWFSKDENLINAFMQDMDLHQYVASLIYNKDVGEVEKWERSSAKTTSFGQIYGEGIKSLAEKIGVSVSRAKQIRDLYLGKFPGIKTWINGQYKFAQNNCYVETPFGRRRHFPFITANNWNEIQRQAVNTPIQSTASDVCLTSLIDIGNRLVCDDLRIILTVHDSILFEVADEKVDEYLPQIRDIMEDKSMYLEYRVPFKVDFKKGQRWGTMEKV